MKKRQKRKRRRRRAVKRCFYSKKIIYKTKEEAELQLKLIQFWNRPGCKEVKFYECPFCHYWHITSKEVYERRKPSGSETGISGSGPVTTTDTERLDTGNGDVAVQPPPGGKAVAT